MNVFDQSARYAIQRDPIGFLRWLAPGLDAALGFHGWLDTRTLPFPGEPDRVCDTVADLAASDTSDPRWAVVTEFQTEPEAEMLDRLLEYMARLRRGLRHGQDHRGRFEVVAALVGLTGPPQPDLLEMALPGVAFARLSLNVAVRTLRDEDAAATLAEIAAGRASLGLLSWISLMRGGGEPGIIEEWKRLASAEPDPRWRADYGAIALNFSELTGREAQWRTGLEGWNMRTSTFVEQWKAEGEAKGKAEEKRADILLSLEFKFKQPIPADLVEAVGAQTDLAILRSWFENAMLATSLDDFRAAIGL